MKNNLFFVGTLFFAFIMRKEFIMHIAIVSLGAFGHINPTLSFVTELIGRGVRITYFTTENFRTIIEETGAKFVPVPSWMAENDRHNEAKKEDEKEESVAAVVPFLFLNEAGAYIDVVLKVLKEDRPDAILHDFAGIAGTMAADILKVPNIMLYTSYPSNASYSVAESFESVPSEHPLRIAADRIAQGFVHKYGCRKMTVREIFDGHGDLNIVMLQKRFVPNGDSFDDSFVFTGVQIGKRTTFGSWTAPDKEKPLLYSSLGTAFNNWPEYYPILFEAVRDLDIHVFAALGAIDPDTLENIPENVEVGQMVPQLDILSQASVFITHAGMGGTGEAIYYGVPMIAIPQMDEQALTAGLIEKNGLGIAFLDKNNITGDSLKAAIEKLLNDPVYRRNAQEFSEDMKTLGGAKASADAIMNFLRK
jgi:MGT family glycosyltransferase